MNIHRVAGVLLVIISHDVATGCSSPQRNKPSNGPYRPSGSWGPLSVPPSYDLSHVHFAPGKRAIRDHQVRPRHEIIFTALDKDKDGNIDVCEWMEAEMTSNIREFVKNLDEADKNEDNVFSLEEFETIPIRWRYDAMDSDGRREEKN